MESVRELRHRAQVTKKRCCQSQDLPGNVFAFTYKDDSLWDFSRTSENRNFIKKKKNALHWKNNGGNKTVSE